MQTNRLNGLIDRIRPNGKSRFIYIMIFPIYPAHSSRGKDRKAAILLAAQSCFDQKGFGATSMSDIQKACHISRGVIYHYFFNKEELILGIIQQNLGDIAVKFDAIFDDTKTRERVSLKEILKALVSSIEEMTCGPGRAMNLHVWSLAMLDPQIKLTLEASFEKIRVRLGRKLSALQLLGFYPKGANIEKLPSASFSTLNCGFIVQRLFLAERRLNTNDCVKSIAQAFNQPEALLGS